MKIHEYQAKEILRKYGVITPRAVPCFSVDETVDAAEKLGGNVWVVKAQIHAGGRGKGGGVKVAKSIEEVKKYAGDILGMMLKTHQTGPGGQKVGGCWSKKAPTSTRSFTSAWSSTAELSACALMASSEGGMDIEEVAAEDSEKIHKVFIDPTPALKMAKRRRRAQDRHSRRIVAKARPAARALSSV